MRFAVAIALAGAALFSCFGAQCVLCPTFEFSLSERHGCCPPPASHCGQPEAPSGCPKHLSATSDYPLTDAASLRALAAPAVAHVEFSVAGRGFAPATTCRPESYPLSASPPEPYLRNLVLLL